MLTSHGSYYRLGSGVTLRVAGIAIVLVAVVMLAIVVIARLLSIRRLMRRSAVTLELTPSIRTAKSPIATEQLFSVIHGLSTGRSRWQRLCAQREVVSLEIISTKEEGIRFIARVAANERAVFERNLSAYVPDVRITPIQDPLSPVNDRRVGHMRLLSFRQTGHFAYPLRAQKQLEQHDPIAYLTGAMTKLEAGELAMFQLVLSAAPTRISRRVSNSLRSRQATNRTLQLHGGVVSFARLLLRVAIFPIKLCTIMLWGWLYGHESGELSPRLRTKLPSKADEAVFGHIHRKLGQPLFYTDIRGLILATTKEAAMQRRKGLRSAMTSFSVPKVQALNDRSKLYHLVTRRFQKAMLFHRLPSVSKRHSNILSTDEVAALYHFPDNESAKTENLVKTFSRNLPAPLSLKANQALDVTFGINTYHGKQTPIGLREGERERHVYIVGGTGNGKTTMLLGAIVQDMKDGKGVAVIDPHGDLAETVLRHVPEERLPDVVYFNPDDLDYPVALNLLETTPGLSGTELMRERDLVTESVISIFRKLFSEDDTGGHRIEYILRNAIQTALTLPDPTIFTIYDLLNDPVYQKTVVRDLTDKNLRNFWRHELGRAGDYQRVKMAAGVTAKIGRFLFSASAKHILEQPHSTINFDDILSSSKILICNVSKGRLGEDTATLFGTTMLARLQIATLRRARLEGSKRRPFYLYVDEFQNFATTSFVQMLSEARKYKLFLTMAEQSTSQQAEQRMVQIILANVGTLVCFRTGNPADEQLLLPSFSPFVTAGELANLPAYNFYARLASVQSQEPMSGETMPLTDLGSDTIQAKAIEYSRKKYAIPIKVESVPAAATTPPQPLPRPIVVYPVRFSE